MSAVPAGCPPVAVLSRLARLADSVTETFGRAHDLEWVADDAGRLQLLRVRPVVHLRATTMGPARPAVLGLARRATHRAPAYVGARTLDDSAA